MVVLHFEDWGYDGFRLEDKSINPLKLLIAALVPTIIMGLCFMIL